MNLLILYFYFLHRICTHMIMLPINRGFGGKAHPEIVKICAQNLLLVGCGDHMGCWRSTHQSWVNYARQMSYPGCYCFSLLLFNPFCVSIPIFLSNLLHRLPSTKWYISDQNWHSCPISYWKLNFSVKCDMLAMRFLWPKFICWHDWELYLGPWKKTLVLDN